MTGDFNIRDNKWDPNYPFYSTHSNLLFDIFDTFNLSFSHPTHPVPTRYSDNSKNSNLVIDLMFLRLNSLELNNHSILSKLWYSLDYAPLVVNIQIIEEFISDVRHTIIKNSKEKIGFTSDVIRNFKKIDTLYLTSKKSLEFTVQEITRTQEQL